MRIDKELAKKQFNFGPTLNKLYNKLCAWTNIPTNIITEIILYIFYKDNFTRRSIHIFYDHIGVEFIKDFNQSYWIKCLTEEESGSYTNLKHLPKYIDSWIQLIYLGNKIIHKTSSSQIVSWLIRVNFDPIYLYKKSMFVELYIVLYDPSLDNDIMNNSLTSNFMEILPFHTFGFVVSTKDMAIFNSEYIIWEQFINKSRTVEPIDCEIKCENNIKLKLKLNNTRKKLKIQFNNTKKRLNLSNNNIFHNSTKLCLGLYSIIKRNDHWSKFDDDCIDYIQLDTSESQCKQNSYNCIHKSNIKQKQLQEIQDLMITYDKLPKFNIIECNEEFTD